MDNKNLKYIIPIGIGLSFFVVGIIFFFATIAINIGSSDDEPATVDNTTTTVVEAPASTTTVYVAPSTAPPATAFSPAEIEIIALEASIDFSVICPLVNDLRDQGVNDTTISSLSIAQVEESYGQPLQYESRMWLDQELRSC